jgi:hypothetical protein
VGIVSSVHEVDAHTQADGGRYVVERHTDSAGQVHTVLYLAPDGTDYVALRTARVLLLDKQLSDAECDRVVAIAATFVLVQQTTAQFAARFWTRLQAAFDSGDKIEYCRLIWWLYNRIQAGSLTSDQVRQSYNTFYSKNLNTTQWNNLVTSRFVPARDRYQAMLNEAQV